MNDKNQILTMLNDEFKNWEQLLAGLTGQQVTKKMLPSDWSTKDVLAHVMAWQQRSIARLEAARLDQEPVFPKWPENLDPNADDVDPLNAWIYEANRARPWISVYQDWRAGFQHFQELVQAIPENDLLDTAKYTWLEGYSPAQIVEASCEHHQEHRDWLSQYWSKRISQR